MNDLALYYQHRKCMGTGDLLTYRTMGVLSSIIHLWSPDNHAGMVLNLSEYAGEECRRWTMEATSRGPRTAYLSRLLLNVNGEVYWHRLKPEYDSARNAIGCFALEQVGVVGYDFGSLFRNIAGRVSADLQKLFCSEYVFLSWREAGIVKGKLAPVPSELPKMGVTLPPVLIVKSNPATLTPSVVNP